MKRSKIVGLVASVIVMAAPLQQCDQTPVPQPPVTQPPNTQPTTTTQPTNTQPTTTQPPVECKASPSPADNLVANSNFNENYVNQANPGTPGLASKAGYAPSPWQTEHTPDLSIASSIRFTDFVGPRPQLAGFATSPSGGSFMGLRSHGEVANEAIFTEIQVTDPTRELTVIFDYTEYDVLITSRTPPAANPYAGMELRFGVDPTALAVGDTGTFVADTPGLAATAGTPGTWEERRVTFTPAQLGYTTAGTYSIYLAATGLQRRGTWSFVDGFIVAADICRQSPPATVPVSTTLPVPNRPVSECPSIPTTDRSLIPNGDFNAGYFSPNSPGTPVTGAGRAAYAPPPWSINNTADLSTDSFIAFDNSGRPRSALPGFQPSPAGGSFVGFRSLGSIAEEGVINTIRINEPSRPHTVFFYYTEYPFTSPTAADPGPPKPEVNTQFRLGVDPRRTRLVDKTGILMLDVPNLASTGGTNGTWEPRVLTFTPADIGFTTPGDYPFYLGAKDSLVLTWAFVDGLVVNLTDEICPLLEPTPEPTPEPPATTVPEPRPTPPTSSPT